MKMSCPPTALTSEKGLIYQLPNRERWVKLIQPRSIVAPTGVVIRAAGYPQLIPWKAQMGTLTIDCLTPTTGVHSLNG